MANEESSFTENLTQTVETVRETQVYMMWNNCMFYLMTRVLYQYCNTTLCIKIVRVLSVIPVQVLLVKNVGTFTPTQANY